MIVTVCNVHALVRLRLPGSCLKSGNSWMAASGTIAGRKISQNAKLDASKNIETSPELLSLLRDRVLLRPRIWA